MRKNSYKPGGFTAAIIALAIIAGVAGSGNKSTGRKSTSDSSDNSTTWQTQAESNDNTGIANDNITDLSSIPAYSGSPSVEINGNVPFFLADGVSTGEFENYSELDSLGRCGPAYANISPSTLPTEKRGRIGMVRPSGWHTVKYNNLIEGNYLYNRCHLIAYELAGENANVRNLITGTRYLNTEGMLPYENKVAEYVRNTGNHVTYRVTPVFQGDNLLASGVLMEAFSVEDKGQGIEFCIYCYNVQPGINIDYSNGDSSD